MEQRQGMQSAMPIGAWPAGLPSTLPISRQLGQHWQVPATGAQSPVQNSPASTQPLSLLQLALLVETQPQTPVKAAVMPWHRAAPAAPEPMYQQRSVLQWDAVLRTLSGQRYLEQIHDGWQHMQCNSGQLAPAQQHHRRLSCRASHQQLNVSAEQQAAGTSSAAGRPFVAPRARQEVYSMHCPADAGRQHSTLLIQGPADDVTPITSTAGRSGSHAGAGIVMSRRQLTAASSPSCSELPACIKPSSLLLPPAHRCMLLCEQLRACSF